jgi:hypothetical protein
MRHATKLLSIGLLCFLFQLSPVFSQEDPIEQEKWKNGYFNTSTYGAINGNLYSMNVNQHNGGVNLTIPLISLKGRAGHDLNIHATYNSKQLVRVEESEDEYWARFYHEGPTAGRWILNIWPALEVVSSEIAYFTTPDGAVHKISQDGYWSNWRYSDDGSNIAWSPNSERVYLPNGDSFDFSDYDSDQKVYHRDRHGNQITYYFEEWGWQEPYKIVDTLGREVFLNGVSENQVGSIVVKNHNGM